LRAVTSLAVAVLVVSGCTGDDDTADETSTTPPPAVATTAPDSSAPAATDPPATTDAPTTTGPPVTTVATTTTTASPTTTVLDEEALKAQIAEDYNAAYRLREEMYSAPTLDGLEERLAKVAVPGSPSYTGFEAFIRELVDTGERLTSNDPDYSSVTAQKVELSGSPPYSEALVTGCLVTNQVRVASDGSKVAGGGLGSAQQVELLVLTPNGWLPSEVLRAETVTPGATQCADV